MTVRENVQMALLASHGETRKLVGFGGGVYRSEADTLLSRVGLSEQARRAASELAYGDVKRLELAMALAGQPALLLMDEPAAGMGPSERLQLIKLVTGLVRETGIGVLFTEHDMDIVFEHANRILVLDRGAVIAEGSADAIRTNETVRAIYLGSQAAPHASAGAL